METKALSDDVAIVELDLTETRRMRAAIKQPRRRKLFASLQVAPFVIIQDTREQLPYLFDSIPDTIVITKRKKLDSGDYSIEGMEGIVSWERKNLSDYWSSITWGRERFEREIARLNKMQFAVVGIEATWAEILDPAAAGNGTQPESITGTIRAWEMDYPIVKWWACGSRQAAEQAVFKTFKRFWSKQQEAP